ncbi:MAG: hypothetical protein ACRDL5_13155, partial [Solirubrobacteraceae bacterium]
MSTETHAQPDVLLLEGGWDLSWTEAGACAGCAGLDQAAERWLPAPVPGTVAGALAQAAASGAVHRPLPDERD